MVASTHSLDDLGVSHIASVSHQRHQHHHSKPAQPNILDKHHSTSHLFGKSTQDKRSRLSNVINNLHKKVPPEPIKCDSVVGSGLSKGEQDKLMMTVLHDCIIKHEENSSTVKKDDEVERASKDLTAKPSLSVKEFKDQNCSTVVVPSCEEEIFPAAKINFIEPCEANESKANAVIPFVDKLGVEEAVKTKEREEKMNVEGVTETNVSDTSNSSGSTPKKEDVIDTCESLSQHQTQDELEESLGSLGAIILDRLSDRQQNAPTTRKAQQSPSDDEVRNICRDLVKHLVNNVFEASNLSSQVSTEKDTGSSLDGSTQSLHCSLPLEKVASVLPNCQNLNSPAPLLPLPCPQIISPVVVLPLQSTSLSKPTSSSTPVVEPSLAKSSRVVRHLCLYCDRKFASVILHQRHTERIHQGSTGRRSSERNPRKPIQQSCQYCIDRSPENLSSLFQHMISSHSDKYYGCLQCLTRFQTKDALTSHIHEIHSNVVVQMEKLKEPIHVNLKKIQSHETAVKEEPDNSNVKPKPRECEFDNPEFYRKVSNNIQENLLNHLDGKIEDTKNGSPVVTTSSKLSSTVEIPSNPVTPPENNGARTPQYQLLVDISLSAVTPVYHKIRLSKGPEDSSELADKPGKSCSNRIHPRRLSFEKYTFPRKYDNKEELNGSIRDLSKFDLSTQLTLRRKQKLIKQQKSLYNQTGDVTTLSDKDVVQERTTNTEKKSDTGNEVVVSASDAKIDDKSAPNDEVVKCEESAKNKDYDSSCENKSTVFTSEFASFMRLKKCSDDNSKKNKEVTNAELTGEWSRPRVYVCGACAERYETMKELEEHKSMAHPNVWCQHFEFSGDQRELYKHLVFLPGSQRAASPPTLSVRTRQQTISERACTKCSKICASMSELHRHMLECGGDQAWLLGFFGNGKKKCKWRPFGSRSRRRRQRGMKRNIQNSQTPRNNVNRERQTPNGPRVRPSDRESIQKMLANLPAKRASRKVLQENAMLRSQGRLRSGHSGAVSDNPASRMVRSKAVLRNKLLKNAKSFQRKKNLWEERQQEKEGAHASSDQSNRSSASRISSIEPKSPTTALSARKGGRLLRKVRLLDKRRNVGAQSLEQESIEMNRRIKLRSTVTSSSALSDIEPTDISSLARKRLLPRASKLEPLTEHLPGAVKKRKGRRIMNTLLSVTSSVSSSARLKTRPQLRSSDTKLANNRQTAITRAQRIESQPSVRLLTRSKLRAAAKHAWMEHTKSSRRITRLTSQDAERTVELLETIQVSDKSVTMFSSVTMEPELSSNSKEAGPLMSKPKLLRTASRNSTTNRRSLDKIPSEERSSESTRTSSRNSSTSRRSIDSNSSEEKYQESEKASPVNGPGRRPKKNSSIPVSNSDELSTTNQKHQQTEPAVEIKTRSQKLLSFSTPVFTTSESRTRRSTTFRDATSHELPKKTIKTVDEPSAQFLGGKEKSGLSTRSNSKAKKEVVVDITAKNATKEVVEKKPARRTMKDKTPVNEKVSDVNFTTDATSAAVSSSKEKEKIGAIRKSLRIKEFSEEAAKISQNESAKSVEDLEEKDMDNISVKPCDTVEEEHSPEKSITTTIKKTGIGKRRCRVKQVIESLVENPVVSEETTTIEKVQSEKIQETDIFGKISNLKEAVVTIMEIKPNIKTSSVEQQENDDSKIVQNSTIEQLQQESSNSNMDSGKENSAEAVVTISKSKIVRPKKTRGLRNNGKTPSNKRSLSNVIGILTEAINVSVIEPQEATTVLTAQTSLDNKGNSSEDFTCQISNELSAIENTTSHSEGVSDPCVNISESANVDSILIEEQKHSENIEITSKVTKSEGEETNKNIEKTNMKPEKSESNEEKSVKVTEQKLEKSAPVVEKKTEIQVQPNSIFQDSANDIILDLSRRKPKGKGSFLEKIVSKIAKQKDVSLNSDGIRHVSSLGQKCMESSKIPEERDLINLSCKESSVELNGATSVSESISAKLEDAVTLHNNVSNTQLNYKTMAENVNITPDNELNEAIMVNRVNIIKSNTRVEKDEEKNVVDTLSVKTLSTTEETLTSFENSVKINNVTKCRDIDESCHSVVNSAIESVDGKNSVNVNLKDNVISIENSEKNIKHSSEVNTTEKNQKNSIDENVNEDKEESCLVDVMRLLDETKSVKKIDDIDDEFLKSDKRDLPHDEPAVAAVDDSPLVDKHPSRKSGRKGIQKRNKHKVLELKDTSNSIETSTKYHTIDTNVLEQVNDDVAFDLKIDSIKTTDNDKSAINLGPIANVTHKNEISDSVEIVQETNETPKVEVNSNEELSINRDKNDSCKFIVENVEILDGITSKSVIKQKKRGRKKNFKTVKELEFQKDQFLTENPSKTIESTDNLNSESSEANPVVVRDMFKIPETTEVTKFSKKRTSKRKSFVSDSSDAEQYEKTEVDIVQKQSKDFDVDNNVEQFTSLSETEEKSTAKQTFKRNTRNSRSIEVKETFSRFKESDDSDASSTSEGEFLQKRRSQRKHVTFESSSNNHKSNIDESLVDENPEKRRSWSRKAKKNICLSETSDFFTDSEISSTELENKPDENLSAKETITKKINNSMTEVCEKHVLTEPHKEEPITKELESQAEVAQIDDKKNETQLLRPTEEQITAKDNDTNQSIDSQGTINQSVHSPDLQIGSFQKNLDVTKHQLVVAEGISSSEVDNTARLDLSTLKKRTAGNFSVVTKSGKILIIEKKKKLTKEAAKFFCDVCATSFTRKSSLKKHNLSQSHTLQITMNNGKNIVKDTSKNDNPENLAVDGTKINLEKEKEEIEQTEKSIEVKESNNEIEVDKNFVIEKTEDMLVSEQNEKCIPEPISEPISPLSSESLLQSVEIVNDKMTTPVQEILNTHTPTLPELPMFALKSPEQLEDEMLDEEICKITENMSHDEYVLTDHVSPITPEATSTPVEEIDVSFNNVKSVPKVSKKKKENKNKKKNLADEHFSLDTLGSKVPQENLSESLNINSNAVENLIKRKSVDCTNINEPTIEQKNQIGKTVDEQLKDNQNNPNLSSAVKSVNHEEDVMVKTNLTLYTDDSRRITRNRSQNIDPPMFENTRPKRNKARPSYKEEENLDFDEELLENRVEGINKESKKVENNTSVTCTDEPLSRNNTKKSRKELKLKTEKSHTAMMNNSKVSNFEKSISMETATTELNEQPKVPEKKHDKENSVFINSKEENNENEEKGSELIIERRIIDLNLEQTDRKKNYNITTDDLETEILPKKKRSRKLKQPTIDVDNPFSDENTAIKNASPSEKSLLEKEIEEDNELFTNKKLHKHRKSQNKKSKKSFGETDSILKISKETIELNVTEETSSKIENSSVNSDVNKQLKPSVLLESSIVKIKSTITDNTDIPTTTMPIKIIKVPVESEKVNSDFQRIIFPSLSNENFKTFDDSKNELPSSMLGGFDSDENSLDTNMSVDIQKLLDDPEMTIEIAKQTDEASQMTKNLANVELNDTVNTKKPLIQESLTPVLTACSTEGIIVDTNEKSEENYDDVQTVLVPIESVEKCKITPRKVTVTPKHLGKKSKEKIITETSNISESSEIGEDNEDEKLKKNKNKIVKCVFGRVFGGEKVKEVLDDWQSRSGHNSSDSESNKPTRKSKLKARKNVRAVSNDNVKKLMEVTSHSRQSKKRAGELISKSFCEDLPSTVNNVIENQKLKNEDHEISLIIDEETFENEECNNHGSTLKEVSTDVRQPKFKKGKKKKDESFSDNVRRSKVQSNDEEDEVEESKDSEDSQLKIEQEKVSFEIDNSSNKSCDKVSSIIQSTNLHDSTDDESLHSPSDDDNTHRHVKKIRKSRKKRKSKSCSVKSPQSLSTRREQMINGPVEMVTIGPTDALEDNALDYNLEITGTLSEKPTVQQTKVLNFDEELFVECCSRLKASGKELRGAKKIKLDHSAEDYVAATGSYHQHRHKKDEQITPYRESKDRWKAVESQNSLGSLLESVNQLLGEEYNSNEREFTSSTTKRSRNHHNHHHHHHHHHNHNNHHHGHHHHHHNRHHSNMSGRSSPEDIALQSRSPEYLETSYDDSLDVAFEHNNKLRDKIQRRMQESESLIATSFGQHKSHGGSPAAAAEAGAAYDDGYGLDAGKAKIDNGFGGIVDKALSNLEKHDHNGSTPMKLLAELACARAPTSTTPTVHEKSSEIPPTYQNVIPPVSDHKHHTSHEFHQDEKSASIKKIKNPIKELFERKKDIYDKRHLEKIKSSSKSSDKLKKQKKSKSGQHNLPLIRTKQYRGGMVVRKRRRDEGKKKNTIGLIDSKTKDVYDFDDEEESMGEPAFNNVLSYRAKTDAPVKEFSMSALLSKAIGDTLTNGKSITAMGENLESMIDRKFKDIENHEPKSKLASVEEKQENIIGPMDEFVERRQKSSKSTSGEHVAAKNSSKSKKKSVKNVKKKSRNAWYEDDSSDEFVTKLKTDELTGVGINKSQRTCSKGKQNLFAEMSSTSSDSEFERHPEDENADEDSQRDLITEISKDKCADLEAKEQTNDDETIINNEPENNVSQKNWDMRDDNVKGAKSVSPYLDNNKKSESELSDHPLVIDEGQKDPVDLEQRTNSDDETEQRTLDLDDLYREDSSIVDSDRDELSIVTSEEKTSARKATHTPSEKQPGNTDRFISIEDALNILDSAQEVSVTPTSAKRSRVFAKTAKFTSAKKNKKRDFDESQDDENDEYEEEDASKVERLPEKLAGNEKPPRESENLPLHVFLSRKVQESKKRKQQELKRLQEEQERERILVDMQPTRRQRKCAIGKQGLLAEISSSDEELLVSSSGKRSVEKIESHEKPRAGKQRQRESKERRKERYIEKKHEQMIAKEQKAIEEAIMRELEEKRLSATSEASGSEKDEKRQPYVSKKEPIETSAKEVSVVGDKLARSRKQKSYEEPDDCFDNDESIETSKLTTNLDQDTGNDESPNKTLDEVVPPKKKRSPNKASQKNTKKAARTAAESKAPGDGKKNNKRASGASSHRRTSKNCSKDRKDVQGRSLSSKRESDLDGDEELKATRSWNKVDEAVGVAIGRRKRAAANQLYYWSSSSDDEEMAKATIAPQATVAPVPAQAGPEQDDKQEQHGWIVGDSHKRMITMLAMEKQMKEKRRRSENDEQSPATVAASTAVVAADVDGKTKKHRSSLS
ncbi:uncharacterized protein LOC106642024 isoform X2 [Copidosoma floridanum]|nr:uncharacterized protein LOC106642024 isoform X2 [Copidosoma floridanum]